MKYVRIKAYLDETFIAEHAFAGGDQLKAFERFKNDLPEVYENCILVAQTIDDEDPDWKEWFRVARNCGCLHFF